MDTTRSDVHVHCTHVQSPRSRVSVFFRLQFFIIILVNFSCECLPVHMYVSVRLHVSMWSTCPADPSLVVSCSTTKLSLSYSTHWLPCSSTQHYSHFASHCPWDLSMACRYRHKSRGQRSHGLLFTCFPDGLLFFCFVFR